MVSFCVSSVAVDVFAWPILYDFVRSPATARFCFELIRGKIDLFMRRNNCREVF